MSRLNRVKWDSLIVKVSYLKSVTEAKRSREDGEINEFIQSDLIKCDSHHISVWPFPTVSLSLQSAR